MQRVVVFLTLFLLFSFGAIAQETASGFVFDDLTKEPLAGVSVFYDGTSIGTITDSKGYFELTTDKKITTSLVLSFIGFETRIFDGGDPRSLGDIFLKENAEQLDEVIVKPDTWSREKKLNIFRREFLGKTQAAQGCKITNERDIRLYHNSEKNILYAYAEVPINIVNTFLGYRIAYNLYDFEVKFTMDYGGLEYPTATYMAGTLFFEEQNANRVRKRHIRNRKQAYFGSALHFMRALSNKRLNEEDFKIFKDKFQVAPYSEFEIIQKDGIVEVRQLTETLSILYDGIFQSAITVPEGTFFIDDYGNHSPPRNVNYSGVLGLQRIANMLPLDYFPKN